MNERKLDIPSSCPSPARIEKTDSSSSRQSGSPPNWEFDSFIITESSCRGGRTRRSSWDDSDEASSPELERCIKPTRLYSSEARKSRNSVADEINQLKKQFFESLEMKDDPDDREKEVKSNDDRRHSPARVRRRTKSSSSSSPVLEAETSDFTEEKLNNPEDEIPSKILELDPKIYLNNFFTELKTKRISMIETSPDEGPIYDTECIQMYNEGDNTDGYFCKTSRKLSQILEVEEGKKEPEEIFKIDHFTPLQTARGRKSEKTLNRCNIKPENFLSASFEHFRQHEKKPSVGSLSERSPLFDHPVISLTAKTGKTQLTSQGDDANPQYVSFDKNSRESTPKNENSSGNPTRRSRRSSSPKFPISLGRDSSRSLKVEDTTPPDSLRKETDAHESESSESKTEINSKSSKESLERKIHESIAHSPVGSSRSSKTKTDTPRSVQIPELNLRLESNSHRSIDHQRTRRSGRSFSPRSKKSTPRGLKITPPISSSSRSKDSLEEQNAESLRTAAWKELEKVCDTLTNRTPVDSVRKEPETAAQSPEPLTSSRSQQKGIETSRKTPEPPDVIEEQDSDVSERNDEIGEPLPTQRSEKRLSVINEVSFEDLETSNLSTEKEEENPPRITPRATMSLKEVPDSGRWNELIKTFSSSPKTPNYDSRWRGFENENSRLRGSEEPEKEYQFGRKIEEKEDSKNSELGYSEPLVETMIIEKEPNPTRNSQNLYYLNLDKGEPFGIGEFGDMACWNAGTDTSVCEKPKDHGDGIQTTEVIIMPEKREKEVKTQRQLWTEVKGDFRISIPEGFDVRTSKSDVSVIRKPQQGQISPVYKLNKQDIIEKKLLEFENYRNFHETQKKQSSSSESLISERVESDSLEFENERTPRLSRSLDNSLNNSETQLFQKTPPRKSTNLKIFMARNDQDKMAVKSNNWLDITVETPRKDKKTIKKTSREYLSASKNVPKLRLRNSNCFRNFYKRFISVFCLTSHSSAATSK